LDLPGDEKSQDPPILVHAPVPPDLTTLWREHCPDALEILNAYDTGLNDDDNT
jgi:hypothetical protein